MLLKRKKRIAALLMAVVIIFTAANFMPVAAWAEEPAASATDAEAETETGAEMETESEPETASVPEEETEGTAEDATAAAKSPAETESGEPDELSEAEMTVSANGPGVVYTMGGHTVTCIKQSDHALGYDSTDGRYVYCIEHRDNSPFGYEPALTNSRYYIEDAGDGNYSGQGLALRNAFFSYFLGADPNGSEATAKTLGSTSRLSTQGSTLTSYYISAGTDAYAGPFPDSHMFCMQDASGTVIASRDVTGSRIRAAYDPVNNVLKTDVYTLKTGTENYSAAGVEHNNCIQHMLTVPSGVTLYYSSNGGASYKSMTGGGSINLNGNERIYFTVPAGTTGSAAVKSESWAPSVNTRGHYIGGVRYFRTVSGYDIDQQMVSVGSSVAELSFTIVPEAEGSISIKKYSANPEITDGNNCYSLKGAVFGIFRTEADAEAATEANENAVATITTDAAGAGSAGNLPLGTYYVKETKASPGYRINTNVYEAELESETPVSFSVPEAAGADPASVLVRKKNSEEAVYLEGAVFAIKYYDVQMTADPATAGRQPVRTWYIKTDEDGFAELGDDRLQAGSDALFHDSRTGLPVLPIGTITVQEMEAPEGYIIDDTIHTFVINDNPEGIPHVDVENERIIPNSPIKQPFELVKLGEGEDENYPLAGAGFSACRTDELVEVPAGYEAADGEILVKDPETGKYYIWDDKKAVILTPDGRTEMFTDGSGHAKSIPLDYGRYIVRETTVPKNFHAVDAFAVTIKDNTSEPVPVGYFIDRSFRAYLRIIKKDDATGKNILNNAAAFKIWSYDKKDYQTFTDSTGTEITELKTNADGVLLTPEPLMPGRYRIEETANPEGYYTADADKTYDITIADDTVYKLYETEDGCVTDMGIYEVEIGNTPYTGVIGITKNGENRKLNLTTGEFETEKIRLSGVTFRIYAAEDIYAADGSGTLLLAKDAPADTVVTDMDGYAASKELPLGTYRIEEETPEGYADMDPQLVTLAADGEKTVLDNEDGTRKETIRYELTIDNHLIIPKIHTTARDKAGNREVRAEGTVTIIDTVYYEGLIPGKPYTVIGYPVYPDGEKLTEDGKPVEVSMEFTPQSGTGSVDVSYSIDAAGLAGKSIVFFEFLYQDKKPVAVHADVHDRGQTITFLPDVPKTGDSAGPVIFILIGAAALAGIVLLVRARRKIK